MGSLRSELPGAMGCCRTMSFAVLPPLISNRKQPRLPGPSLCPCLPTAQAGIGTETRSCLPQVLIFLQALLTSKKHKGEQETTALLKEAVELHFSSMQGLPLGSEYFEKLDPYFLVCIAKEYLLFCPKQVRGRPIFVVGVWSTGLDGAHLKDRGILTCDLTWPSWGAQCSSNLNIQHTGHLGGCSSTDSDSIGGSKILHL